MGSLVTRLLLSQWKLGSLTDPDKQLTICALMQTVNAKGRVGLLHLFGSDFSHGLDGIHATVF